MSILLTIENVINWMHKLSNMGKHIQATLSDEEAIILENYREKKGMENVNSTIKYLIQALDVPKPDTPKEEAKQEEKPTDDIDRSNYDKWIEALNLKKL